MRYLKQGSSIRDADALELQVRRYAAKFRRRLRRFGKMSHRYADLLFTFPAACVAVVTGHGSPWTQEEALQLVRGGAELGDVASAFGLPAWLRWLPPEAFDGPLPPHIGAHGRDAEFTLRILNTLPQDPKHAAGWLRWVLAARDAGDDDFIVWVATHALSACKRRLPIDCLMPLAMFACFSRHPELEAANLMTAQWTPKLSVGRAASLARQWLHAVLQDLCLEEPASARDWAQPRLVDGFEFVPLLTSASLVLEGACMRNCLATYSANVVWGTCRLYSVRRNGLRVANMEIRPVRGPGLPQIAHLLGPGNANASDEVWQAALTWLQLQSQGDPKAASFRCATPTDSAFQRYVWQPYCSVVESAGRERACPPSVPALLHAIGVLRSLEKA